MMKPVNFAGRFQNLPRTLEAQIKQSSAYRDTLFQRALNTHQVSIEYQSVDKDRMDIVVRGAHPAVSSHVDAQMYVILHQLGVPSQTLSRSYQPDKKDSFR